MRKLQYFLFLFCLLANSLVCRLQATTIHVSAGGSIQSAITNANSSVIDTIMVAAGTYTENLSINGKNVCLFSEDGAEKTIIDGNHNGSVLTISGGSLNGIKVKGFTLTHGKGTSMLVNLPILGNINVLVGAGILCRSLASPILSDLIITENDSVYFGGGIFIYNNAIPTIINTIIRNNIATYGGGIWASDVNNTTGFLITLKNVIVNNNYATTGGGGIGVSSSTYIDIVNSNIVYNRCDSGNGAALWRGSSSLINLTNCIVWGNNSTHFIYNAGGAGSITNNVSYSNLEYTTIANGSYTLPASNISASPHFYNIFHQNYHLTASSPCLNMGTSTTNAPNFDIDNQARPLNGTIDIGADEFDATVKDTALQSTLDYLAQTNPLKYDYKPDGLGGMYAKHKLIVTYKNTTQASTKDTIRASCTGLSSFHVSLMNPQMEEWTISQDVDDIFEDLGGAKGTAATSSPAKPVGLDKNAICSGEMLKNVLNFNGNGTSIPNLPPASPNDTLIAFLDGGIDPWHLALANVIWRNPDTNALDVMGMNFIDTTSYNICDNQLVANPLSAGKVRGGHGTHVAGIIAEIANLNLPNNHYKILPIKVLDGNGVGNSFSVFQGILYAIQKGAKVINLSLGYTGQANWLIYQALDSAYKENIIVVAAAGNSGRNNDSVKCANYPSSFNFPNIITVGASDSANNQLIPWAYSNYSSNKTTCARSVDMFASGRFMSLIPSYSTANPTGTTKGEKVGTSMAAAFVTGKVINEMKIGTPLQNIKQNLIRLSSVSDGHLNDTISISGGTLLKSEQTNWNLPNKTETANKTYIALDNVTLSQNVGGSYVVTSTANVEVKAGGAIVFKPGFIAQNTNFEAKVIEISDMFCPYEAPSFPARYASPVWVKHEQIIHQLENEEVAPTQTEIGCRIYPNPFTEETNIEINLPEEGKVSVEVLNILGEKVSVLWKEEAKEMGTHTLTWNAVNVTQGVYFVKIYVNGAEVSTKKVILL